MLRPGAAHDPDLQLRLAMGERALLEAMVLEPHIVSPKNALTLDDARQSKLYRIASGSAVCRRVFADGRSQITSILVPGDLVGLQALLDAPSFDLIEALEPMSVASIRRSQALALLAENAKIALWLLWYGEREIQCRQRWLAVLAQGNALERTAILLLDFYRRAAGGVHRARQGHARATDTEPHCRVSRPDRGACIAHPDHAP